MKTLYSIGHSNQSREAFLSLLQKYSIAYLIDIRSRPYSRFNPQYNQKALDHFLSEHDIRYVFMGNELGGRPEDPSCYNTNGYPDYEKMKTKDFFIKGINWLRTAYEKEIPAAIMCSEGNPAQCHRSRLIGKALLKEGIILQHIKLSGELNDQIQIQQETDGNLEFDN